MATGKDGTVGRRLQTLFDGGVVRELTDGQLLERFVTDPGEGGELAFAALVERHGPMVLRVARGVAPNDARDVFQATFLVLVAKARGLWVRDSLGPWLHQVAYRTASCRRSSAARRRRLDRRAAIIEGVERPEEGDDDLAHVLHEEINRLPERFRVAVVLCDLEGHTHEQAALALGWPVGTVKSRQARARERLRDRLTRRGAAPGLGLPAIRPDLGPTLSMTLVDSTTAAAVRFVLPRAVVPGTVAALAREVIRAMTILRWAKAAPFLLALGVVASGTGLIAQNQADKSGDTPKPVEQPQAAPANDPSVVEVKPGKLNFTLFERGVVDPPKTLDVINGMEQNTTILRIRPEGSQVKKGNLVAELESAGPRYQLTREKIIEQQAETASKVALPAREVAEFALKEYAEGIGPRELENVKGKVANAQTGIEKGRNRLERTKLARKRLDEAKDRRAGPEGPADIVADLTVTDRLDAADLDLRTLTLDLETAKGQQTLLENYTLAKMTRRLQIDVEKARSDELTKQSAFEEAKIRVKQAESLLQRCKLLAPGNGMLVYANNPNRSGGGLESVIEEGAVVHDGQKILSVVDLTEPMRIIAKVPESTVEQVKPGQAVRVKVEAIPNEVLSGTVQSVAPFVDPEAFALDRGKVYSTLILLDKAVPQARPGMKASVEILLFDLDDVLSVPVASVLHVDAKDRVALRTPEGGIELREVTLGRANFQAVEVKQGLQVGDRVILDPSARKGEPTKPLRRDRPLRIP